MTRSVRSATEVPEPPADVLNQDCPSRTVLRHLTDRWTPMIVTVLADGRRARFTELRRTIQGSRPRC